VQDTFVAVWRGAQRWAARGEVAAWIWGIGIRQLLDRLRRRTRVMLPLPEPSRTELSAEERVLLGVQYGDLGASLAHLSPELRAVVQATVLDGLTTPRGGAPARHPGRNGQDPDDARSRSTEGGADMTGWHLDGGTARRYASGAATQVFAASAEAHLSVCAGCRRLLVPLVDPSRLDSIWGTGRGAGGHAKAWPGGATTTPYRPPPGHCPPAVGHPVAERFMAAGRRRDARLCGYRSRRGPAWAMLFLTLAPMLPVAGVAVAYGRAVDPIHEIGAAAPYSSLRLLLLRSAAVVATTTVLAAAAGLLLPASGWTGAAWLLPALALTALTLVLSVRFALVHAAAGLATTWVVVVVGTQAGAGGRAALAAGRYAAFGATGQLVCLVLMVVSIAVLAARRRRYAVVLGRAS
jgi:hypothetical protein